MTEQPYYCLNEGDKIRENFREVRQLIYFSSLFHLKIFIVPTRKNLFDLKNDGRVSTVSISSYTTRDTVENFFSCHIYYLANTSTKAFDQTSLTFGVAAIDKNEEFESTIWKMWTFIRGFVVACFLSIITWCLFDNMQRSEWSQLFQASAE